VSYPLATSKASLKPRGRYNRPSCLQQIPLNAGPLGLCICMTACLLTNYLRSSLSVCDILLSLLPQNRENELLKVEKDKQTTFFHTFAQLYHSNYNHPSLPINCLLASSMKQHQYYTHIMFSTQSTHSAILNFKGLYNFLILQAYYIHFGAQLLLLILAL
jgi:hypothetical protein